MSSAARCRRRRLRLVTGGVAGWVLVAVAVRAVVLLPERCPAVDEPSIEASARAAVTWFAANQRPDGSWLYRFRAATGEDLGGYNVVRHAGVLLSLYQAEARGLAGAAPVAARGLEWATRHLVSGPGWSALGLPGEQLEVGATALLVAALVERRAVSGDGSLDGLLDQLGRFLVAQLEPSGAVPQRWDPGTGTASVGSYSRFYTGEVFWALTRLQLALPDGPWAEPALRVGRYLVRDRDRAEGWFPPISDHCAAYGLAELARWPDGATVLGDLDPAGRYATRLGQLAGVQVRYESQRSGEGLSRWTRGPRTSAAGLGTIGESEDNLWVLAGARGETRERTVLAERAACVAGMLVDRQVDTAEAPRLTTGPPSRVAGAWLHGGVTQMDDQQHALSALLQALPIVAGR